MSTLFTTNNKSVAGSGVVVFRQYPPISATLLFLQTIAIQLCLSDFRYSSIVGVPMTDLFVGVVFVVIYCSLQSCPKTAIKVTQNLSIFSSTKVL